MERTHLLYAVRDLIHAVHRHTANPALDAAEVKAEQDRLIETASQLTAAACEIKERSRQAPHLRRLYRARLN
jgi:hypothetical protein